jgi:hypothetical protein
MCGGAPMSTYATAVQATKALTETPAPEDF